ncbi:MAG: succinate dehydrogenase [Deltaproteobacteria bacterium]|nr:succinate dehydrogenase [Deltaproteobacteria bacterium]
MIKKTKRYDSHLGITGWAVGGRWGLERYLYTLHRITGLGILLFFMIHIFESSTRLLGMEIWNTVMGFMEHPIFKTGEALVIIGFAFHATNGIRLILIELGFAVGKAEEPVYPYKSSINVQRPLTIVMLVISILLIVAGGYDLLILGH